MAENTAYDDAIEGIARTRLDIIKETIEYTGIDCGPSDNKFEYRNYMAMDPIIIVGPGGGGGGHWEEITFGEGGGISISGKKVGFVGDSWFDHGYQAEFLKQYVEGKGGTAILNGYTATTGKLAGKGVDATPYSLVAGWGYEWPQAPKLFEYCKSRGAEMIICDFGINGRPGGNNVTDAMKKISSSVGLQGFPVYSWGIVVVSIEKNSDEAKDKQETQTRNEAIQAGCSACGWNYISCEDISCYNDVCKFCRNGVYHLSESLWKQWAQQMLDKTFGSGGGSGYSKEQLDQMRASGSLPSNIKYDASTGKYYRWVGGSGGGFAGGGNVASGYDGDGQTKWISKATSKSGWRGIRNWRDLGGTVCEGGKRIKYGLLYRGSTPNHASESDKAKFKELNIGAILNLRGSSGEKAEDCQKPSWFTGNFLNSKNASNIKECIQYIVDNLKGGRPVYFHCHEGLHRTGKVAQYVLSACGASDQAVSHENLDLSDQDGFGGPRGSNRPNLNHAVNAKSSLGESLCNELKSLLLDGSGAAVSSSGSYVSSGGGGSVAPSAPSTPAPSGGGGGSISSGNLNIQVYGSTECVNKRSVSPQWIVVHYTAGGNSRSGAARGVCEMWVNKRRKGEKTGSADFVVDDEQIYQFAPSVKDYSTWNCDDSIARNKPKKPQGGAYRDKVKNSNSIGIELCSSLKPGYPGKLPNEMGWYYTGKVLKNGILLIRKLMQEFGIPISNVIRHYDASGKACPGIIGWNEDSGDARRWYAFKNLI